MTKKKKEVVEDVVEVKEVTEAPTMYKSYDIRWLKSELNHPDYGFVAEYEEKYGKI